MPISHDNTPAEIEAFDDACRRLAGFEERLTPEWVDGYLTALAAGPRALSIDDWLPPMCGDAFDRCFGDPDDAGPARAALSARWRALKAQLDPQALLDDPDRLHLQPLMAVWDDEARARAVADGWIDADGARELATGQEWFAGFAAALADFDADWSVEKGGSAQSELEELLAHVAVLSHPEDSPEHAALVQRLHGDRGREGLTRDDLVDEACFAIQDLRVWWLDHGPRPPTRRVAPTPGRNDPCPCGSGRKFKKCHGAAA